MQLELDVRVGVVNAIACRVELGASDVARPVQQLSLQVGDFDNVEVDEPDGADAGRGEVQRGRRAQPSGADDEDPARLELALAVDGHFGKEQVPSVAQQLVAVERWRRA